MSAPMITLDVGAGDRLGFHYRRLPWIPLPMISSWIPLGVRPERHRCRRLPWTIAAVGVCPAAPAFTLDCSCRRSSWTSPLPVFVLDSGLCQAGFVLERSYRRSPWIPLSAIALDSTAGIRPGRHHCRRLPWTITITGVCPAAPVFTLDCSCQRSSWMSPLPAIALAGESSMRSSCWQNRFKQIFSKVPIFRVSAKKIFARIAYNGLQ